LPLSRSALRMGLLADDELEKMWQEVVATWSGTIPVAVWKDWGKPRKLSAIVPESRPPLNQASSE
jgi:hypothetical protein